LGWSFWRIDWIYIYIYDIVKTIFFKDDDVLHNKLNNYWLYKELCSKLQLSNPAYHYWKNTNHIKLNNKYLFIQKETLPSKYSHIEKQLSDLSGYLPVGYASDRLHVDSHVFSYEKMKLYNSFEYKYVENVKFVNIRRFFREYGIRVKKDSIFHLGKISQLEITPDSTFYKIVDDYAIVVYD
jgi:hypothetical protein